MTYPQKFHDDDVGTIQANINGPSTLGFPAIEAQLKEAKITKGKFIRTRMREV